MKPKHAARLMIAGTLLFALLCGCNQSSEWYGKDQQYAVNLNLSTNRINVGSIVTADLDILHPRDTRPVFTDPGDGKHLIVRDRNWNSRELDDGRVISSVRYRISSFELGEHRLFRGKLKLMRGEEDAAQLEFGDSIISVESLLKPGEDGMRDIAGCERFPGRFPRWLPILILIALLAALAGALIARLYRRKVPAAVAAPRPPADEIAMRDLHALRARNWIEEGAAEPFYVELSRIVRNYIEDRFGLRAPEQTTEEFIRDASGSEALSLEHRQLTSEFLRQSDMVKFARYKPDVELMSDAYNSGERLVLETSPHGAHSEGGVQT